MLIGLFLHNSSLQLIKQTKKGTLENRDEITMYLSFAVDLHHFKEQAIKNNFINIVTRKFFFFTFLGLSPKIFETLNIQLNVAMSARRHTAAQARSLHAIIVPLPPSGSCLLLSEHLCKLSAYSEL